MELPRDIELQLIKRFDIDTRIKTGVVFKLRFPKDLTESLDKLCNAKAASYKDYLKGPGTRMVHAFYGTKMPNGLRKEKGILIYYLMVGDELRMQFEAIETTKEDPDGPWAHIIGDTETLRLQCCVVNTGKPCPVLIGDGSSDFDTDSD
jgi:hypothetical protein